jgi:protein-serine/threonine kinase
MALRTEPLLTRRHAALIAGDYQQHDPEAGGHARLLAPLQIPKNRSTGNLAAVGNSSEKARIRFSFDAGPSAAEYDTISRLALEMARGTGERGCWRPGHPRLRARQIQSPADSWPSS